VTSDPEYHELLAAAYQQLGRHEEASMTYRLLLQQRPDRAAWWVGYGISREALDQPGQALEAYSRARRLGGLDPRLMDHANRRIAELQARAGH
jgi:tetratricopeptide (TPR) repeat protein